MTGGQNCKCLEEKKAKDLLQSLMAAGESRTYCPHFEILMDTVISFHFLHTMEWKWDFYITLEN